MTREVEHPDDGRWIVVDVRTSRGDDDAVAAARARVQLATTGLGERGTAWWDQDDDERRARWETALRRVDG
jgi:hypothetical protein